MEPIKVLLVDDSLLFRGILSHGLKSRLPEGSQIETAGEPFSARDKILSFDPDVMVLDVEMPNMNGIEFLRRLIVQYNLPTVVSSSRPAYKALAMEAGAFAFLEKPNSAFGSGTYMDGMAAEVKLAREYGQLMTEKARQKKTSSEMTLSQVEELVRQADAAPQRPKVSYTMVGQRQETPKISTRPAYTNLSSTTPRNPASSTPSFGKAATANSDMVASAEAALSAVRANAEAAFNAVNNLKQMQAGREVFVPPKVVPPEMPLNNVKDFQLIAIGASTGGTEALSKVLKALRPPMPPIVIVQHIPPMFSKLFAERLHNECHISVKEAENGDKLEPNWAYVAPGNKQMKVKKYGGVLQLDVNPGERVNGHCPSVDVLFDSVVATIAPQTLGVILTGMGDDGADGLVRMRQAGSATLGQDEATCVVYGMPRAAYERGGVEKQLPIESIAGMISTMIAGQRR